MPLPPEMVAQMEVDTGTVPGPNGSERIARKGKVRKASYLKKGCDLADITLLTRAAHGWWPSRESDVNLRRVIHGWWPTFTIKPK